MDKPCKENGFQHDHAELLMTSFERLLGRPLVTPSNAEALYTAPFVVLSHNTADNPILTYGNAKAQALWELAWEELTSLPSRQTAEPGERAQRDVMFEQMRVHGFFENYEGIRVSSTGRRFMIKNAVIWTLTDPAGEKLGEAATFADYTYLD
jgi:hypothetical protein